MKPEYLCSHLDGDLFVEAAWRHEAAKMCNQCPAKQKCLDDGYATKAQGQVRGGVWFGKKRASATSPTHEGERLFVLLSSESRTEQRLRTSLGPVQRVESRHEVWKIGVSCQNMSNRSGSPCTDPICRAIRNGQKRQRVKRLQERRIAA